MTKMNKLAKVPKVFVADHERYDLPVTEFGKLCFDRNYFLRNPMDNFKLVLLTGGEDISPGIYGQKEALECGYTNPDRDARDVLIYQTAFACGIPILGICRGAQLVCVLNGGALYQHTTGHTVWHDMRTSGGNLALVSSTHHQMMIPTKRAEVLAWADQRLSKTYIGSFAEDGVQNTGEIVAPEIEPEVVFYPESRALAVQYHPEYMGRRTDGFRYFARILPEKLGLEQVGAGLQDPFISLPRPILTRAAVESEERAIAGMTDKEKTAYLNRKYREEFISSRVRYLRSLFWGEARALADAMGEYRKMIKLFRKNDEKAEATN